MSQPKVASHPVRLPIKNWPEGERPREKLRTIGAENLSAAELIAILIGSGNGKFNAVEIGKQLLLRFRSLEGLSQASCKELQQVDGIGDTKAVILKAAFELTRKMQGEVAEKRSVYFKTPADVARIFIPKLAHLKQEVFAIAFLDSAGRYSGSEVITVGTLNSSLVHPREVFKSAIREAASSIILVHNHPSGQMKPSNEDLAITNQLMESGRIIDIPVQDHLIVAGGSYISLREEGYWH